MNKNNRREFIRKSVLKTIGMLVGIDSFASNTPLDIQDKAFIFDNGDVNWESIREKFQLDSSRYYFNYGSLGLCPKPVSDRLCLKHSALESTGLHDHVFIENVRTSISSFLNTSLDEVAITRNTTEGMNIIAHSLNLEKDDEVIITSEEHIGGSAPWLMIRKYLGIKVKVVPINYNGKGNLKRIKDAITSKTKVVSVSHITCTTGTVLPVKDIVALCRENDIYSVIDGAQALGMIPVDLGDIDPDFYCSSGHKWMGGPKETGILFVNKRNLEILNPRYVGAYSDSSFNLNTLDLTIKKPISRVEYGTRSLSTAAGLDESISFINKIGIERIFERCRKLACHFRDGISSHPKIEVLSPENEKYASAIVTFRIKSKDNLSVPYILLHKHRTSIRGIHENDLNALRASFHIQNSLKEVDDLIALILSIASE